MWLCKYDLSKECDGKYNDCVDCVLDEIRAEIAEYKDDKIIHAERNEMIDIVFEIINKHREEQK